MTRLTTSFEAESAGSETPADPFYSYATNGTHEVTGSRATDGSHSFQTGQAPLGSPSAIGITLDIEAYDSLAFDIFTLRNNPNNGNIKVSLDGAGYGSSKTRVWAINGELKDREFSPYRDQDRWYRGCVADLTEFEGERELIFWVDGDNRALWDNIQINGEQTTATPTSSLTQTAPTPTPNRGDEATISPQLYSYYPAITINSQKYHVLNNLDLSDESASWAVIRGDLSGNEFELASVDNAAHAFAMQAWRQRPNRDYQSMITDAENKIIQWESGRFLNEISQLGADALAVIVALKTGNPSLAVGTFIETVEDAASWIGETATNPYEEAFKRLIDICRTQQNAEALVADIEDISEFYGPLTNTVDKAVQVHLGVSNGVPNYTEYILSEMSTVAGVAGVLADGASTSSILYAIGDEIISRTVSSSTNGYETLGEISGIAIGMHNARIPLLKRLDSLQQKAKDGRLQLFGSTDSIYAHYSAETAHAMVNAVGNAATYELANDVSTTWAGPLYDTINNTDDIASSAQEAKESYLDLAAAIHDLAGNRFTMANNNYQNCINVFRQDGDIRRTFIPGIEVTQ